MPNEEMNSGQIETRDGFGRQVDYLRISVTDRCNERCLYCMPEGYKGWSQRPDHLSAREIVRVVRASLGLGFRKFRLTGGEPLLRSDIVEIAQGIAELPGLESLGLSTNGTRLESLAGDLRCAGVDSLNVSLDSLDPFIYRKITGGSVESVLAGLEAATSEGFASIKLNCVLMRGINEDSYLPLVQFAAEQGFPLRFIELMPLSRRDVLDESNFLSVGELMDRLQVHGELVPLPGHRSGHGPAQYFEFRPLSAIIGFIGAITTPGFCESCNKVRLTADGKLRPCLGNHGEIDFLSDLRSGIDPTEALRAAVANKPETHEFNEGYAPIRPMTAIGG
ncbi:MAG: GTP 3',8-cyclase MoaA [Terrimicrobiaceae bacterium]